MLQKILIKNNNKKKNIRTKESWKKIISFHKNIKQHNFF